jgi:WD40 repeat protein
VQPGLFSRRVPDGVLVRSWQAGLFRWAGELAFSPDGRLLAAWTAAEEVTLWQVASGEVLRTLAAPGVGLELVFSPDSSVLAGGSMEGPIYLWRVDDGTLLHVQEGHTAWVSGLAFSPDERLLFSASADGTVRVWGVR